MIPRWHVLRATHMCGRCDRRKRQILISSDLRSGKELHDTLIHEMAHAHVGESHGRKFLAELKRLAGMGLSKPS